MLAPIDEATNEHVAGARIFRNAELVFQFEKAMRFTDATQIAILECMRTRGGKPLSAMQWEQHGARWIRSPRQDGRRDSLDAEAALEDVPSCN